MKTAGVTLRFAFVFSLVSLTLPALTEKPDVLLVTIDTLRADHVGCYGYSAAETPNINRLAADGVMFTNAVSHVPLTRPSHASIFTGLYPYQHGIHDNVAPPLNQKIPVLAETLKQQGYATAAFVSSFVVNSQSGLQRGFDQYNDDFDPQKQPAQFALNLEKRGDAIYQEFSSWLQRKPAHPYFAWIHLYDPHFPYEPPAPYSQKFSQRLYDGEIAYADSILGKILKLVSPGTLIVLTSDHGESLGEHGENAHSFFIYDSTLRVPLIIKWPAKIPAGEKLSFQTRLVDLYPTILDLLGMPAPSGISGISLKKWISGAPGTPVKEPDLISYCETFTPWLHFGWSRLQGVRTAAFKYIEAPRPELYNLKQDSGEMKNLFSSSSAKGRELKQWLQQSGATKIEMSKQQNADLDPETLEKLASLGYAGISPPPGGTDLADPKDKIQDFKAFNQLIREGVEAFQKGEYSSAAAKFQQLKDRNVPSFEVHYYLGRSFLRQKSYDKSSTELKLALQKLPHFLPAYRDLSEALEGMRKDQEAEKTLLAGLAVSPNNPALVQSLAWFYQRHKRLDDAEQILMAELKEHPEDVESRFRLGSIYRDSGKPQQAIEQFQKIIQTKPDDAEAHNQLGMLYGGAGNLQKAIAEFQRASELAPESEHIRKNLEMARSKKSTPASFKFRIIQTKTRAAAETILRKLQQGEPWETLAKDYSIHSSARAENPVIEAAPEDVDPKFSQSLSTLSTGQISPVIETSKGFFILRKEQ